MDNSDDNKQLITDELSKIPIGTSLSFQDFKKTAPTAASEIEGAVQRVNADSAIDQNAELPNTVKIVDEERGAGLYPSPTSANSKPHLDIHPSMFSKQDYAYGQAELQHEIGHEAQAKSDKDFSRNIGSLSYQRGMEYEADRYADAKGMTGMLLKDSQQNPENYDSFSTVQNHPSNKERIRALAEERAGNEIFGHSGKISTADGTFQPNRDKDGMPVTEDGKRVTNWDGELAPAIEAKAGKDMRVLDYLMDGNRDGKADLTNDDVKNFQQYLDDTSKEFKQEHQPQYEPPNASRSSLNSSDKQQLAHSFRYDDHSNQVITQRNIVQEPRMADAYAAHYLASESIRSSGLHPDAHQPTLAMARENIASGIERDEYPNIQRQENVEINRNDQVLERTA